MKDLGKASYPSIGYCIYCGSTEDLRKEHILPFGLSGTATLARSTCPRCADITSRVELDVLRGPMRSVRVFRQLRSRSKHTGAPSHSQLDIVRGGKREAVELPCDEYPILLHFPLFSPPAYLYPTGYQSGINMMGIATISFGPRPEEVCERLGADEISVSTLGDKPASFARLVGKIAYAFAFAEGKLEEIDGDPHILPSILGITNDIGRWVGTLTKPIQRHENQLHRLFVHEDQEKGLLIGEVQLFADSETPSYGVILGNLK